MIIVIANQKGGSGKTATCLNLIEHLNPDVVLDADHYHGLGRILYLSNKKHDLVIVRSIRDLKKAKGRCVIIDCGGFDSDITRQAISMADIVITPTSDDPQDQFALIDFNEVLSLLSVNAFALINRVNHARRDFTAITELVDGLSNIELLPVIIPSSTAIPKAAFNGGGVKSGPIAAKYSQLAKIITLKSKSKMSGKVSGELTCEAR